MTSAQPEIPPSQRRLPKDTIDALTHEYRLGNFQGRMTVGFYEGRDPAMISLSASKEAPVVNGLLSVLSETTTLALQYGVPLEEIITRWKRKGFEPSGRTSHPQIPSARSIVDYAAQYLELVAEQPEDRKATLAFPYQDDERTLSHKMTIGSMWGYIAVETGKDAPGAVRRVTIQIGKEGGIVDGLFESVGEIASLALHYNVPLKELVETWKGYSFEPSGFTQNAEIPHAKSVIDYVGRFLELRFLQR